MIFGINTTGGVSKLLYVISRAVRRVKFETILKYHKWTLFQISIIIVDSFWVHYSSEKFERIARGAKEVRLRMINENNKSRFDS